MVVIYSRKFNYLRLYFFINNFWNIYSHSTAEGKGRMVPKGLFSIQLFSFFRDSYPFCGYKL